MATPRAAWGIEIGAYAIKAIRLERDGEDVKVADFAVIPHRKVLTTPDLDQDEMVRLGLGQFISQKNLEGEHLVMSVPGHSAFARFAKLPPVEPKKVPDIVKFEAVQQIPFPIDEVEWDYQTFTSQDTPEIEVGIFAITRERVQQRLGLYSELGLTPESMTLSPVSVFNALSFDMGLGADEGKKKHPVVFIDIGTQATDVIVAEAGRCWIRTFPLGGTHFTEAIASAFKLSYSKAEKLKLEASDSKYAKQIMQAMRPVFSDLLQDLQRSISYYQSLHRESQLSTMIGIGSTFKIPGLRKFLSQQLAADSASKFEIIRLDEYKRIGVTGREAASFAENAVNMATAYGLALQGVGLAPIGANLVPVKALRESMWHSKVKWFAAAAALVIIGAGMTFYRPIMDRSAMRPVPPAIVSDVISRGNQLKSNFESIKQRSDVGASATNMLALLSERDLWPHLLNDCASALAMANPQPELLGDKPEAILAVDPKVRRLVQLEELQCEYIPPSGQQKARRVAVTMMVELSHDRPAEFLNEKVAQWLRDNAEPVGARAHVPYRILGSISTNPQKLVINEVSADGQVKPSQPQVALNSQRSSSSRTINQPNAPRMPDGARAIRAVGPVEEAGGGEGAAAGGTNPGAQPNRTGGTGPRPINTGGNQPRVRPPGEFGVKGQGADVLSLTATPTPPQLYPPNSQYFTLPITFEIELIEKAPAIAETSTTAGMPRDGGAA